MQTLVVYDSYFGNTEKIARAIAEVLASQHNVKTMHVNDVTPELLQDVEMLIVGSPTRAFKATPPIAEFVKKIPTKGLQGVSVAAFDTRISADDTDSAFLKKMIRAFGYAAEPLAKRLEKRGGLLLAPGEGFFVQDTEGPLKENELERARAWASQF